jgi:hypothetical protein
MFEAIFLSKDIDTDQMAIESPCACLSVLKKTAKRLW